MVQFTFNTVDYWKSNKFWNAIDFGQYKISQIANIFSTIYFTFWEIKWGKIGFGFAENDQLYSNKNTLTCSLLHIKKLIKFIKKKTAHLNGDPDVKNTDPL